MHETAKYSNPLLFLQPGHRSEYREGARLLCLKSSHPRSRFEPSYSWNPSSLDPSLPRVFRRQALSPLGRVYPYSRPESLKFTTFSRTLPFARTAPRSARFLPPSVLRKGLSLESIQTLYMLVSTVSLAWISSRTCTSGNSRSTSRRQGSLLCLHPSSTLQHSFPLRPSF